MHFNNMFMRNHTQTSTRQLLRILAVFCVYNNNAHAINSISPPFLHQDVKSCDDKFWYTIDVDCVVSLVHVHMQP